jgi:ATP-dependent Zn protease
MDDLDMFRSNRDFYRRTGKPWKRGYLLYGLPGTGKSTMIAAMANHLNYDIYNVEFTIVNNNNDLRKLLIQTTSMSIIVIEDIDCSLDLTANQRSKKKNRPYHKDRKVTLSGLFNFIDRLRLPCGLDLKYLSLLNMTGEHPSPSPLSFFPFS